MTIPRLIMLWGAVTLCGLGSIVACGHLLFDSKPPLAPTSDEPHCAVPPPTCSALLLELHRCEAVTARQTKALAAAQEPPAAAAHPRARIIAGPARKCAGDAPVLKPVAVTECKRGLTCLDAKAQRALTINLAAWEAFYRRVQECEERR